MAHAGYEGWLQAVCAAYPAPQTVYAAVDAALRRHGSLRPRTDYYREGGGALLIVLAGPLLCNSVHLVPVEVWLPHAYSTGAEPPAVWVRPGPGVPVRPTAAVGPDGRVAPHIAALRLPLADLLDAIAAQLGGDVPFYPQSGRPVAQAEERAPEHRAAPPAASPVESLSTLGQRLARRYAALQSQLLVEANCVLEEADQVAAGEASLAKAARDLKAAVAAAEADLERLRRAKDAITDAVVAPLPADEPGDVVDLSACPQPDLRRILLCAEDEALGDAITALFRAREGRPFGDVLRVARLVARDQFFVRELLLARYPTAEN